MDLSVGLVTILEILPREDLCRTWPADRTIMLRLTSKKVNDAIDKIKPPTIISFNNSFWNNSNNDIAKKQELMIIYLNGISTKNIIISLKICNIELFNDPQDHTDTLGMCSPGIISLATAIDIESTITNINLNDCKIGLRGIIQFSLFVNYYENLTHLNISKNSIGPTGIKSLAKALENCLLLYHIDLSWNHIGHNGANSLANLIMLLKIKHLNLGGNRICNIGSDNIAKALSNYPVLEYLDFSWNYIESNGVFIIAKLLALVKLKLKYLNLGGNRIDNRGIEKLTIAMLNYPVIEHINFNDNQMGPNGVNSLTTLLNQSLYLKHLELCSNQLNDIGIEKLASVLGHCTSLIHLNLSGNIIGNTGINKLSLTLSNISTLMHLDLSFNKIGTEGAEYLASMLMLEQCSTLKHLDLRFNMLGNKGKECFNKVSKLNVLF
jgi:Ran GTPase-activating protein (RanGAP) involved in mRNA processing and transport